MDQPVLDEVLRNARSADATLRGRGMQSLWTLVQKDSSLAETALPIFRAALSEPTDSWTISNALRGVRLLAGEAEYHAAAVEIANYSDAKVAARVIQQCSDFSFAADWIELMRRRPDAEIQIAAMRTLGRMHAANAFDPIVANLLNPEFRPHAIESLGDLGDPRAVSHLEPLLTDRTEAWQEDNHGPMLYVRDLAQNAINKLRADAAIESRGLLPLPGHPSATPPPLPALHSAPLTVPTVQHRTKATGPVVQTLLPYMPLILALAQIPWFGVAFFVIVIFHEDLAKNQNASRLLEFVTMLPGLIGLVIGVIAITRWPVATAARVCLIVGMVLCGLPQIPLGHELIFG